VPGAGDPVYYPVLLELRGRSAVVIGGGAIAEQKVRALVDAGARVTVVSPELSPPLAELAAAGAIAVQPRAYRRGDLAGATIAIAAMADQRANAAVWEEAESTGVLLNAVDDVPHCHFIAPSVLRRGSVVVTVSSSGKSPALAVRLRERIAEVVREEHGALADLFGEVRSAIARLIPELGARTRAWYRIVDALMDDPSTYRRLRDRRDALRGTVLRLATASSVPQVLPARAAADGGEPNVTSAGMVALVGAGPGDPGLLTVRGRELLESADVVVHDRLIAAELLALARPQARLIDVGKEGYGLSCAQERVTGILCAEARRGLRVVRLKGGDPFVFGRGGEELLALAAAGVPCEVVPGVSSAISAPAAARIPVTHRGVAPGFAVVTAVRSGEGPELDWGAVARMPTVVVLMGLRALGDVVVRLLSHGASPQTPAAVISAATLPGQRTVTATLATIAAAVHEAGLAPPATLVVGEVVRLAAAIDSSRPLHECA
jgi:uroporphyrin-III C-methyltransferase/precorrin-2 dehydrogenase/sirohydrochlorin ferrochelatase